MATHLQDQVLDSHTPIEDDQEIQVIAMDLLSGLQYIHSKGVIHCDFKLDNILAHKEDDDKYPIYKICDFGLAHQISTKYGNKALKNNIVGTWGYIAPEVRSKPTIG